MIKFAIHTYGHSDAMFFVLNGIKMIMNSDFTEALIKLLALVATSYYSLQGMARANDGQVGHYFMKTGSMLIVITSLLMPKADILIIDRVSGNPPEKVDNLPYAFVLPVGVLEAIGAGITSLFEQAFSTVSSTPFKDYGMIFGQRIVQESRNWKISNPEFASNMNIFIKRCVVLEAMIGARFTPNDVFSTNDIFGLVTNNGGTFRTVDFIVNKHFKRLTCKDAGMELKNYFQSELSKLVSKYKNTDFLKCCGGSDVHNINNSFNKVLAKNIELGYKSTFGANYSAGEVVRQNMMINAIADFNNVSDLYGYSRASDMQKSNWKISGDLAKENLPAFLNILKCLIYSSFIFVVPMMILSGGIMHYMRYCVVIFSLQIWPALNAVLNLFIELYSKTRLSGIVDSGISYTTFNQAHDMVDTIVLMASGLQLSIPFLSFAIVQGGVGSFVHLASSLQGASSGAAASASSELTSGNRNFDNISRDNMNMHNKSCFKVDLNPLHHERAMQVQRDDGTIEKTFADGSISFASGAGVNKSSGTRSFIMEDGVSANLTEGYHSSVNSLKSMEQHYQKSKNEAVSSATDRVSHLAQRQAAGKNLNIDTSTDEGKALQQAINNAVSLHDRDGYDWTQSASTAVNTYVEGEVKTSNFIPFVELSSGVKIDGTVSAENNSNQSLEKQNVVTSTNDTNRSINTLLRAASNEHYTNDDSIDQSLAKSTKASYDEMQSYGESIAVRKEEVENYNKALQAHQSKGMSDRQDKTHDVELQIAKEYGVSQADAHQMIESGDRRASKVWNDMVQTQTEKTLAQVRSSENMVRNSSSMNANTLNDEYAGRITNQSQIALEKKASEEGLDQNLMQEKINKSRVKIEDTKDSMTQNANDQIHSVEHHNKTLEKGMSSKIKEYEKDRIGQGFHAKKLNVGGLTDKEKDIEYLKNNEKIQ